MLLQKQTLDENLLLVVKLTFLTNYNIAVTSLTFLAEQIFLYDIENNTQNAAATA